MYKNKDYTIGKLYIDGEYFCDILEDTDRGITQNDNITKIKSVKVYGKTAIPKGTYYIDLDTVSPKFKDKLWAIQYDGKIPRLKEVPGFDGVLIHPGNTPNETLGCLLCGDNKVKGKVINSVSRFHELMKILLSSEDNITISIK